MTQGRRRKSGIVFRNGNYSEIIFFLLLAYNWFFKNANMKTFLASLGLVWSCSSAATEQTDPSRLAAAGRLSCFSEVIGEPGRGSNALSYRLSGRQGCDASRGGERGPVLGAAQPNKSNAHEWITMILLARCHLNWRMFFGSRPSAFCATVSEFRASSKAKSANGFEMMNCSLWPMSKSTPDPFRACGLLMVMGTKLWISRYCGRIHEVFRGTKALLTKVISYFLLITLRSNLITSLATLFQK